MDTFSHYPIRKILSPLLQPSLFYQKIIEHSYNQTSKATLRVKVGSRIEPRIELKFPIATRIPTFQPPLLFFFFCGTGSNASLTQGRARRAQGGGGCKARRQRKSDGLMVRHARTHTNTHTHIVIYIQKRSVENRER